MSTNVHLSSFAFLLLLAVGIALAAFLVWWLLARSANPAADRIMKIIGRCIKYAAYAVVIGINAILIWRMLTMGDPDVMEKLMVSDRTAALWQEKGEEMQIITQYQDPITEDGQFSQSCMRYLPEINQLQVTARYNNSTIRTLAETLELAEGPARSSDLFDITLVKVVALTEEEKTALAEKTLTDDALADGDETDGRTKVRYFPAAHLDAKKTVYNYRRLLFEAVDLSDADELYLEFYYRETVNYDAAPYGRILIWRASSVDHAYDLTKDDLRELKGGAVSYD